MEKICLSILWVAIGDGRNFCYVCSFNFNRLKGVVDFVTSRLLLVNLGNVRNLVWHILVFLEVWVGTCHFMARLSVLLVSLIEFVYRLQQHICEMAH